MGFRSVAGGKNVFGTSISMTKPTGLADGDVVVIALAIIDTFVANSGSGTTTTSGFTKVTESNAARDAGVQIWKKKITSAAGEPATWDFTLASSFINQWFAAAYSGLNDVGVSGVQQDVTGTTWTAPTVTCGAAASSLLTVVWADGSAGPIGVSSGDTGRTQQDADFTSYLVCLEDSAVGSGPTGTRSSSCANNDWIAINVTIEPGGGGGGGITNDALFFGTNF